MNKKKGGWLCIIVLFSLNIQAQVNVTNNNTANVLAQNIVGTGVEISNASILCNANQSGTFTVTSSNLGMDSGIVLTTGLAATSLPNYGVNGAAINFANLNQGTGGDADLTNLSGISTFDRCVLEFDFKANGDSIFFNYKFGSEEYPAFNCSNYNDVFGFFITGPGYATPTNIALVPGTTIPVAINSVNNGVISSGGNIGNCNSMGAGSPFTNYYIDNTGGTTLTYGGFTQIFTAKALIQNCGIYHLKLAIADGFDHILDSGVFLKAGSLNSNTYKFTTNIDSSSNGIPYLYEGCDIASIKIHRINFQSQVNADTVTMQILGTATNGVDYPVLQTAYTFTNALSDSIKTFTIAPINDLITEGTETIKLIIRNKCNIIVDSITIDIKDPPKFTLFNNDTTICLGSSVQVNGVHDNGLTFSWSPTTGVSNATIFNPTLTPTVTTSYILTSQYGTCVPFKDTINIIVQPLPIITTTPTNILCSGANTGSILATGTVASNPLTFTLAPNSTSITGSPATFSNLAAGTYTVTITSGLGCTKTSVATINQPTALSYSTATTTNIACNLGNIGQIHTTVTGGTGAISYNLMPNNITNSTGTYTNLAAGTYTVLATDANGCTNTTSLTITQVIGLSWGAFTKINVTCIGLQNGTVNSLATGGNGTITYVMNPGGVTNTTGQYANLNIGNYTITATDVNGCSASTVFAITQPAVLNFNSPTITNVLCNGASTGAISISTTGGTPSVTYVLTPTALTNTTGVFSGLTAGAYTILATDNNGCSITTTVNITQAPILNLTNLATVNPSCNPGNNGSITVSANGGTGALSYQLNSGAFQSGNSFTNLISGTYTITVKDANGCTKTSTTTLSITNLPLLTNNTQPPLCNVTTTLINVVASNGTPPYSYTLMPNNITNTTGQYPNMPAGTYIIDVFDANGCTNSITVIVDTPINLIWASYIVTNIPCTGVGTGSISCTATNGVPPYSYQINPSGTSNTTGSFPNLSVNTYTVLATDANGCTVSQITNISVLPALTFNIPVITNVTCNGNNNGTILIATNGGTGLITYSITPSPTSNTTGIFTNLSPTNYTITASDATTCSTTTVVTITQPNVLAITNVSAIIPTCIPGGNGSLTISASGGTTSYNYTINNGTYQSSNLFSNLNIGTYTITVKDANNCTKTSIYNLINPNSPSITAINVNQANCAGSSTGGLTTVVSGGIGTLNYTINPLGLTNTIGVFNALPVNIYTVTVTDANGCSVSSTATIQQPSSIIWNAQLLSQITCNGLANGSITQTASGGNGTISYNLMPSNTTNNTGIFSSLSNNTYTIIATDANGCSINTSFIISNPTLLTWGINTFANVSCFGVANGTINVIANGGTGTINYNLMPGNITNTTGNFVVGANTYTITATDVNGCNISFTHTITQPATALLISSIQNTIPTCTPGNNATITVNASGGVPNYLYSINGGLNQGGNVFTGIGVSTYTINVTDAVGCSVTSTIAVANPSSPSITNVTSVNILCFGGTTGSIATSATGGTGALTYTLNPGTINNSTGIYTNLPSNTYTVIVADANNCSASSNVILSQPPPFVWDSVDNRDVPCFGGSNGLVASSASGGAGNIIYTLLPNNVSNTIGSFFGLGLGQYTLNAVDNNGCIISSVFIINQSPQIIWTTSTTTPTSCFGGNNGTINVLAAGGVPPFQYKLMPGAITNTTGSFTNLSSGAYTITAKDANSCTATTIINVIQPPIVQLSNAQTTNASCSPGCDASVNITATGGNNIYTYSLDGINFQVANSFTNLCTGIYTITIKDGNNCLGTGTFTISTANGPNQISLNATNVPCNGGNTGSITTTISGGTGTINYTILPTNTSNSTGIFSNLTAGNYTVTATDANGCTISATKIITQPTPVVISNIVSNNILCNGGNNGSITITASGGTGTLTYLLQPTTTSNTTGIFSNLSANTYTIIISDVNDCSITTIQNITQPTALSISSATNTAVTCNGQNNGTINVVATGGAGILTYTLLPNNTSNNTGIFSGLSGNNYTINVVDANNCSTSTTQTIFEPSALLIASASATNIICSGQLNGEVTITGSGGVIPLSYTIQPTNVTNTTGTFIGLGVNTYTVTITDANGCTNASVQSVYSPTSVHFNSTNVNNVTCFGQSNGSINVLAGGGVGTITYLLNPTSTTNTTGIFTALPINNYTITATDINGCAVTTTLTITQPTEVLISSISNTSVTCNGANNGTITTTANGGTGTLTYNLQPTNTSNTTGLFTNLSGNIYTITITDANGCSKTSTTNLFEPTAITIVNANAINIVCYSQTNGTISISANGGTGTLSYNLQPTNTSNTIGTFTNLSATIYTVTITDANGCTITNTQTIIEPTQVNFTNVTATNALCNGQNNGTITATATGGVGLISYTINPSAITNTTGIFTSLNSNTYTIIATDANGCSVTTSMAITQPQVLDLVLDSTNNITCNGGNDGFILTHALGGTLNYTYTLMPNNMNASTGNYTNLFAGNYTMLVTDAKGCKDSINAIILTQPSAINFTSVVHQDIICYKDSSGSITVAANGGVGNIVYSINPSIGTQSTTGNFINLVGGNYTITATDSKGCTKTTTVLINNNLQIVMNFDYTEPTCNGDADGSIKINVTGGIPPISFSLNGGVFSTNNYFPNLSAGIYGFTIKDLNNCIVDTNVVLTQPDKVNAKIILSTANCNTLDDGKIKVQGVGGRNNYTYYLRPGLYVNTTGNFIDIKVGTYTLTVKDSAGCTFDTLINILPPTDPIKNIFTKQDIGCFGYGNEGWAKSIPSGGKAPYLFTWTTTPVQTTQTATDLRYGIYGVTIIDANGCELSDSIYINPGPCCDEIFIPNAFSPNADGRNDEFRIVTATGFELIQLEVYDRWGNKVWSTTDATKGWNGKYNGVEMDMDTYFYVFRYNCLANGEKYMKKGDVQLIR